MDEPDSQLDAGSFAAKLPGKPVAESNAPTAATAPVETIEHDAPTKSLFVLWMAAALFNFIAMPLTRAIGDDPPILLWASMLVGVLPGEVGALALWVVWGEGSFLRRLAIHWGVASVLWLCLMTGLVLAFSARPPPGGWHEFGLAFCLLPLASFAAQAPLWPLRTYLGWRVERRSALTNDPSIKSLSIGDILLATGITAVTLALVRMIPGPPSSVWGSAAVVTMAVMLVSVFSAIPALIVTLRMEELGAGMMVLAGYSLIVGLVLLAVAAGIGGGGPMPGEAVLALFVAIYAFAATLIAPLIVYWAHGYRLSWPRDRKAV